MTGSVEVRPRTIRIGHLTGSPVPCKIPLYRALAEDPEIDFSVVYASSGGLRPFDGGFDQGVSWDVDLLGGYRNTFLKRADRSPILGDRPWSVRDPDIVRVLRRERFDVLWLDGYNSVTYALAVATQRALGGAMLFREEQTLLHSRSPVKAAVRSAVLKAMLRGQHALYIGSENRRWFEHYGVERESLHFAPYTVDNDTFQSADRRLAGQQDELKKQFGLDPQRGPVAVTVCRLVEKKQPLHLLEAFKRARRSRPCQLLVVGSGPLEAEMQSRVAADGIEDVRFAGFLNQSQVVEAYACADVFTLLSKEHETFGLVVLEAMNFGLPLVLSSAVGSSTDLVQTNGVVVDPADVDEAATALGRVFDGRDLREEMGQASRRLVDSWHPRDTAAGVKAAARAIVVERTEL